MKITCDRSRLAEALGIAGRVVSPRNTTPILSNVLLSASGESLKIVATDLDTALRCSVAAKVDGEGSVAIPAHLLSNVVSKLPDASATIEHHPNAELTGGLVSVRCGKSNYKIMSLPGEDYPDITEVLPVNEFTISEGTLRDMLRKTVFAASDDEYRALLTGALFEAKPDSLTVVATDTHRLAKADTSINLDGDAVSAVVPAKPLKELMRILSDSAEREVHVRLDGSQVQFQTSDVTLSSRLLDGQFPAYQRVIPDGSGRVLGFDREELLGAMQRVYIVARGAAEKIVFSVKGDVAELTAESPDIGKALEVVSVENSDAEKDLVFAFNARYVMNMLTITDSKRVELTVLDPLRPTILRASNDADYLYIAMPMAV